ncbi:MAG0490 family ComEA-like DNA-binding protein [Mycoplasma sp. 1018B]|uniref:MAG0490 family ComEA-like DNA-binding protein n=1 Tax=Mycoplasma sp. 1018B TaxID=2967302 RepID=UPI00211CBBA0|nr:helix-hairpin-helix domain-containing protein [Mycoplasma sp. 1018B]UUM19204.1 helix-hairpin-helix domain-containing protein [Mycoplasma sp. 1018B]
MGLLVSFFSLLVSYFTYTQNDTKLVNKIEQSSVTNKIKIKIIGAVEKEYSLFVNKGISLKEIIKQIKLKNNADLIQINENIKYFSDTLIKIPFKRENYTHSKLNLNQIKSIDYLTKIGLNKKIAKNIYEKIEKNEIKEWNDLLQIKGLGKKTLEKIKQNFVV